MKWLCGTLWVILIILIGVQFIPRREIENYKGVSDSDISKSLPVPAQVEGILRTSCYDCHSNNIRYPWYYQIQPVNWYMSDHIEEGLNELNFSEFGTYSSRRQKSKLRSSLSQVQDGEMPLSSYTLIHRDAKLKDAEIKVLEDWITGLLEDMDN